MSSVQNFTVGKFKKPVKNSDFFYGLRSVKTVENYKVPMNKRNDCVRQRNERVDESCKKSWNGKIFSIFVDLEDEESGNSVRFKGFNEKDVVPFVVSEKSEDLRKVDEDCETGDDEIEFSARFLSGQLEEAVLNNFEN